LRRHLTLLPVELRRGHRWVGERVLDDGREAAGGRSHRARREVLSLRMPWVLEMSVRIDPAREHMQTGSVDAFVAVAGDVLVDRDPRDTPGLDHEVGAKDTVVGYERAPCDRKPLSVHPSGSPASSPACRAFRGAPRGADVPWTSLRRSRHAGPRRRSTERESAP